MNRNQHRKKAHKATSGRNQAQASKISLPVKSHRTHLIPPATSCDNTCDTLSTREAEAQRPGFYCRLVINHPHPTPFQESQKEDRAQHKSHSLQKQAKHKETLLSFRESGSPSQSLSSGSQPRVKLASRPSKESSLRPSNVTPFLHDFQEDMIAFRGSRFPASFAAFICLYSAFQDPIPFQSVL